MKDLNATVEDDSRKWTSTWEPMIARVGSDLSEGELTWGADEIEPGAIRRYLEPLELDCPLHYDREVARAYGFSDVTAPYTSILTFTIPAMWNPGQRLFTSHDRDAQPASSPINGDYLRVAPEITGFFATDIEIDFLRPAVAGERLGRSGNVLLSCVPKWISVGRGAFMTLESKVLNEEAEVVALIRTTVFAYEPIGPPDCDLLVAGRK